MHYLGFFSLSLVLEPPTFFAAKPPVFAPRYRLPWHWLECQRSAHSLGTEWSDSWGKGPKKMACCPSDASKQPTRTWIGVEKWTEGFSLLRKLKYRKSWQPKTLSASCFDTYKAPYSNFLRQLTNLTNHHNASIVSYLYLHPHQQAFPSWTSDPVKVVMLDDAQGLCPTAPPNPAVSKAYDSFQPFVSPRAPNPLMLCNVLGPSLTVEAIFWEEGFLFLWGLGFLAKWNLGLLGVPFFYPHMLHVVSSNRSNWRSFFENR